MKINKITREGWMKGWVDEGMGRWRDGWIFKIREEYVKISVIQRIRDKKSA